ncbi:MAG: hypothetical protein LW834_06900 [Cyanobium sp. 49614_E6]|jgi:hypothetical protein|nr:hypothetical protein [Cyanobium sp. 49614_E6]
MAFNIDQVGSTFSGEVKLSIPIEGGREDVSFTAIFERGQQTEIEEMREKFRAYAAVIQAINNGTESPAAAEGLERLSLVPIAEKVLVGWGDDMRGGDDNEPMEFTPDSKKRVIEFPGMADALVCVWNTLTDPEAGKKPTSKPSRGNGIGK